MPEHRLPPPELQAPLSRHAAWLDKRQGGEQLNAFGTDYSWLHLEQLCLDEAVLNGATFCHALMQGIQLRRTDLYDTDFSDADLTGAIFDRSNLRGALFHRAKLTDASFADTDFRPTPVGIGAAATPSRPASFDGAVLDGASLKNARMEQASMAVASARGASFTHADLTAANLASSDFSGADFSGASLKDANLVGAKLDGANLKNADLRNANLRNVDLSRAETSGAKLAGAVYRTASSLPPPIEEALIQHSLWIASNGAQGRRAVLQYQNLAGCNFSACDLHGAQLHDMALARADFTQAKLVLTSFIGSDMADAVFDRAEIHGANFTRTTLTRSRWRDAQVLAIDIYNTANQKTGRVLNPRFDGATLERADLRGAVFEGINFTGVPLTGANIAGTEFRRCTGIQQTRKIG